ncbi:MAG: hypothetical protein H7126_03265 [Candidatus Parcubacteria bacterium]|nr:hypothetical protein [Leptolyngbyaceae cyanobacterium LF-bin-113]
MSDELIEQPSDLDLNSGLTPPPREPYRSSLKEDIGQGWAFVQFVWRISKRIRGSRNRIRFIIGLIFWKPFLPDDR